jgi:hypothetical protein
VFSLDGEKIMSDLKQISTLMSTCSKGHALFGKVNFCPFCGETIAQVISPINELEKIEERETPVKEEAHPVLKPTSEVEEAKQQLRRVQLKDKVAEKSDIEKSQKVIESGIALLSADSKKDTKKVDIKTSSKAQVDRVAVNKDFQNDEEKKSRKSSKGWIFLLAVGVFFLLFRILGGSGNQSELACNEAFEAGLKFVAAGDFVSAKNQGIKVNASCTDSLSSKAQAFQTAVAKEESATNECHRNTHAIQTQIENHRLVSARNKLDQLDVNCAKSDLGVAVREQINKAQLAVSELEIEVRQAIAGSEVIVAKQALAKIEHINREYPDLASFKSDINAIPVMITEKESVSLPATQNVKETASQHIGTPQDVPNVQSKPVVAPNIQPHANSQADMAKAFLQDAENALSQRKFDVAKTYVESARRMDPNNLKVEALSRLIRERERQILQQETTIK